MATTTSGIPPPPPAPNDITGNSEPSFLQKFIRENSQTTVTKQEQYTKKNLESLCLIPISIPEQALPDIKPLVSLSESDLNKNIEQNEFCTAMQDFREIVSLCANYQQTSDINRKIFQFKTKRLKLKKELRDAKDIEEKERVEQKLLQLEEPLYNEEYSDLKVMQNYALANIYSVNRTMCVAHAVCPKQTKELVNCYNTLNPQVGMALAKQGLGTVICMDQREAVERCVGNASQRVVREALN